MCAAPPTSPRMTNIAKELRAELAAQLHPRAARDRHRAGLDRRHAQMAAAPRRRQGGRDGLHPRGGSRHAVHLEPGRLHAHLQLLPHRHADAGAQPHRRARSSARSWWRATASATGPAPSPTTSAASRHRAQDHQRRADGHGRAALQFRQRARRHGDRRRRRGHRVSQAPHHALDLRRRAEIPRWGEEAGTMLAISLHAVRDELRDTLVPINKK